MFSDIEERSANVVKELIAGSFLLYNTPQHSGLFEVLFGHSSRVNLHFAVPVLVGRHTVSATEIDGSELGSDIVWVGSVIAINAGTTIPLIRVVDLDMSAIGKKLLVVGTQAIAGSIWVSKHASLEDCSRLLAMHFAGISRVFQLTHVCGRSDTWDHVGRRESGLFDVLEVVVGLNRVS